MTTPQKEKFNYRQARKYLVDLFEQAEKDYQVKQPPTVADMVKEAANMHNAFFDRSFKP